MDLEQRLSAITGDSSDPDGKSINDRIVAIRAAITVASSEIVRRRAALLPFDSVIGRYLAAKATSDLEGTSLKEAGDALGIAIGAASSAEEAGRKVQERLEQQSAELSKLEAEVAALAASRQSLEQIATITTQERNIERELESLSTGLGNRRSELDQAEATIAVERDRQTKLAALDAAASTAKLIADRARELSLLEADLQAKIVVGSTTEAAAGASEGRGARLTPRGDTCSR